MTVLSVTALTIKPDRYEDFLATTKKSKSILEKHGAKNVRLIVSMSGETSGSFVLTHEADDFTDAGRVMDKFLGDPEGLALMMESGTENGRRRVGRHRHGSRLTSDRRRSICLARLVVVPLSRRYHQRVRPQLQV